MKGPVVVLSPLFHHLTQTSQPPKKGGVKKRLRAEAWKKSLTWSERGKGKDKGQKQCKGG